jgi:hypothetical protein
MRSVGGACAGVAVLLSGCAAAWKPPPEAPTRLAPAATPLVEWNGASGTIRCRSTTIAIPEPLRPFVRNTGPDEVTLVPPWSPPGGALVVTSLTATQPGDAIAFLQDLPAVWGRLHRLASGKDFGSANADANISWTKGRIIVQYAVRDRSSDSGRLVYLQIARCRIAALDLVGSQTSAALTELLDGLDAEPDFAVAR